MRRALQTSTPTSPVRLYRETSSLSLRPPCTKRGETCSRKVSLEAPCGQITEDEGGARVGHVPGNVTHRTSLFSGNLVLALSTLEESLRVAVACGWSNRSRLERNQRLVVRAASREISISTLASAPFG